MSVSSHLIEIIPNRLHFSTGRTLGRDSSSTHYFSVDTNPEFQYQAFYYDFGPLSLLCVHKFKLMVDKLLASHERVCFTTSTNPVHLANAVLLIGCYRMIHLQLSPNEAYEPLSSVGAHLRPYRDASTVPSMYDLTVLSCLRGLHKAMSLGWYKPETFDAEDWEKYEQVENGDMNWLIPGKLLAFATAYDCHYIQGWKVATPRDLVPVFKDKGITCVVRLCQKFYEKKPFVDAGIKHVEMYFMDGSNPPLDIREKFLALIEGPDIVALHCKAGLGRTGTLAGCYMIKNFGFTAAEAIGWIRLCRPGSVIGPQQKYLVTYEHNIAKKKDPVAKQETPPRTAKTSMTTPRKHVDGAPASPPRRTTARETKIAPSTPEKPRDRSLAKTPTPKKTKEESGLRLQTTSLTPKCPQPRKYRMAAHQMTPPVKGKL